MLAKLKEMWHKVKDVAISAAVGAAMAALAFLVYREKSQKKQVPAPEPEQVIQTKIDIAEAKKELEAIAPKPVPAAQSDVQKQLKELGLIK